MIRIRNIKVNLDGDLKREISKLLKVNDFDFKIVKRSIDARKKNVSLILFDTEEEVLQAIKDAGFVSCFAKNLRDFVDWDLDLRKVPYDVSTRSVAPSKLSCWVNEDFVKRCVDGKIERLYSDYFKRYADEYFPEMKDYKIDD